MNWLNIHTPFLRSPEFIGCDPVARAAWLCVFGYCAEQENGGVIRNCRGWKDRQWQQTCGVTLAEIESAAPLLKWDSENLVVLEYPADKENEVAKKREAGRKGGQAKTQAKTQAARKNGACGGRPDGNDDNPSETQAQSEFSSDSSETNGAKPKHNPSENPTEGEGERKGNRKGKEPPPAAVPVPPDPHSLRPTLSDALTVCENAGVTKAEAEKWWHARNGSDWMKGTAGGGTMRVGRAWQSDMKSFTDTCRQNGTAPRPEKKSEPDPDWAAYVKTRNSEDISAHGEIRRRYDGWHGGSETPADIKADFKLWKAGKA